MMKTLLIIVFGLLLFSTSCNKTKSDNNPTAPEDLPESGEYYVDIYDPDQACNGTTLLTDGHNENNLKVVEVDMDGEIVWEFNVPQAWINGTAVGFEAELLANGNILMVLSQSGIYEIDRNGNTVWEHLDPKCSHDADRLQNGNTIFVYGNHDTVNDPSIKEVDTDGNLVWQWKAVDHYNTPPYNTVDYQGWCHANAVTRLQNGNTLISIRNFDMTIEVNPQGTPVWEFQWQDLYPATDFPAFYPHEPEIHPDNTLLVCLQIESPYELVEINRGTGNVVWEYDRENIRTCRDGDRLPNGNVLVVGVKTDINESVLFEVTPEKEVVWQLRLYDTPVDRRPGHFYKAQRICQ